MLKITVLVITYNEEKNIGRCLASVRDIADEIIVADSHSTDQTVAIAASLGAKIISSPFLGYGEQKNMATTHASNNWILSLDADEVLTPQLASSIQQIPEHTELPAYEMSRITNYCGKWIRHCGWYPDRQTRLYNRTRGNWIEKRVHEFWQPTGDPKKGLLQGDLLHYSFLSVGDHLKKIDKYTTLAAEEAFRVKKNTPLAKLIFSPIWHFITEYIFKLGFLDGYYGFVICRLSAYSAFLKGIKTRMLFAERP